MVTLNLHINYDCPLKCRYCVQRLDPNLSKYYLTAEQMIQKVQDFLDFTGESVCRVNISGGEPLLKYKEIQQLMEHFPNNQYEISTSGYLLTEEKAKFFSYYGVHYVLSVDGTERVTNHLRPLANGELGYFKQFKKNVPHILYYSPKTRAKLIVSKNIINEVFNTYLELERLGFQEIFITPNVYENEVDNHQPKLKTGTWLEEDWQAFREQIFSIVNEIRLGYLNNKKRCLITNIENPMAKMLFNDNSDEFCLNKLICTVLDFKGGSSPEYGQMSETLADVSLCIAKLNNSITTQRDLVLRAKNDFAKLTGECPLDKDCPYQKSCVYCTCLAENIKGKHENIWTPTEFQCKTQKIYHDAAMQLLQICLELDNDAVKQQWLRLYRYKEGFDGSKSLDDLLSSSICRRCM